MIAIYIYRAITPIKGKLNSLWWAGLDSNQRSREAVGLQPTAIAAMRPTHIGVFDEYRTNSVGVIVPDSYTRLPVLTIW